MNNKASSKLFIKPYAGFTLAEMLVTLIVIGVVAALTIPALLPKTNDAELRTALKKAYSDLSQAVTKMAQDNGSLDYYNSHQGFKAAFMPYLSVSKDCGAAGCVPESLSSDIYKTYYGRPAYTTLFGEGQFILTNGMIVMFHNHGNGWVIMSVDVNGYHKPPNIWGRDVFTFVVYQSQLRPLGIPGPAINSWIDVTNKAAYCNKNQTGDIGYNGASCALYALADQDY